MARAKKLKTRGRGRKILRLAGLLFLIGFIACVFVWRMEWPQRAVIRWAGHEFLGAEIEARNIRVRPPLSIGYLHVFDIGPDGAKEETPLLSAQFLTLHYGRKNSEGRYSPLLDVGNVTLVADLANTEDTNFDFIRKLLEPSDGDTDITSFLPEEIIIRQLGLLANLSQGSIDVSGLSATIMLESVERFTASLTADRLLAGSYGDLESSAVYGPGTLNLDLSYSDSVAEIESDVSIPDIIETDARITVATGETPGIAAEVANLRFFGRFVEEYTREYLPWPVAFEVAEIRDATFATNIVDGVPEFPDADLSVSVTALQVGESGHELYSGDIAFDAQSARSESNEATFELALNDGQRLRADVKGNAQAGEIAAAIEQWSPDQVRGAIPADFRSALDAVSYESAGGYFAAKWSDEGYDIDALIQSHGSTGGDEPIDLTLAATGGREDGPLLEVNLTAKLGEGSVDAALKADTEDAWESTLALNDIDPRRWTGFVAGLTLPEGVDGKVSGDIHFAKKADAASVEVRPALRAAPFTAGGHTFETVDIDGRLAMNADTFAVTSGELNANADSAQTLTLRGMSFDPETRRGDAHLTGNVDLYPFVTGTEFDDLFGTFTAEADVRFRNDRITAPLKLVSTDLFYGDYGVPYGKSLEVTAEFNLDGEASRGDLANVLITIPERAEITGETFPFTLSPFAIAGRFAVNADAALAVDMTFLGSARGTLEADGDFSYLAERGLLSRFNTTVNAPSLILPDEAAHVEGLSLAVSGEYGEELTGEGMVSAVNLSAAGANLRNVTGRIALSGDVARIGGVTGTLFNGPVIGDVAVGLFEEDMPIYLSAQYEGLDLARLTEEVQPPQVKLTGIASGSASLRYSATGLEDFTVRAYATENLSLDRETVEELIFREKILERFSTRQLQKILREFAGEAPQRPFDAGELYLRLEEGRIRGTAEVTSEKTRDLRGLTLIVEIAIDPEQLADTLVLLEKGELDKVEL